MLSHYDTILQLTSQELSETAQQRLLNDFAEEFGWRPSDHFIAPQISEFASAHLLVEHGLENTAVLTFLRHPHQYSTLSSFDQTKLLSLSYNNLVDWHIPIGSREVSTVFNRVTNAAASVVSSSVLSSSVGIDKLRSEIFEQITGKRPNPNIPALDDALVNTISRWKRLLSAELGDISNQALSALFNAIMFARAIEDHARRIVPQRQNPNVQSRGKLLLHLWDESSLKSHSRQYRIKDVISKAISSLMDKEKVPSYLLDKKELNVFDDLDGTTTRALLSEFYRSTAIPYEYDFSVMSKHALSRIYEHYVSVLRHVEKPEMSQLTMFSMPTLPEEEKSKAYGGIYTPQFIARFFAKFLRNRLPHGAFLKAKAADPACGSGIFLRTLLELRFEVGQNEITTNMIRESFNDVIGVDIDINAAKATRLSLALLSLALTDSFPKELKVKSAEGIEYFQKHQTELRESQDAIMANPPFVALDMQPPAIRERIAAFMSGFASGRIDSYLPFLRIGMEMLKPGGFGMFVLPHSFLLAQSGTKMRQLITEQSWILCLADLSAIRVFGEVSSYVVLVLFQKKTPAYQVAPPATVVKCQDLVGRALQDALDNRFSENNAYSVYEVGQDVFQNEQWSIVPPTESGLQRKFEQLPKIDEFLYVRQGFVSGSDNVFIIPADEVPEGESDIFVPYLPDREMRSYVVPDHVDKMFFYPYVDGKYLTELALKKNFPKTWKYLLSHKVKLQNRASARTSAWWKPTSPRVPERMMRPKIVTPHLVIVPRFSLDIDGKYAVSHSPLLYPKDTGAENDLLRFFVAVLNSRACYWHISTYSHVYRRGYAMLEVKTLKETPVPDPAQVPTKVMNHILRLVDRRMDSSDRRAIEIEEELDDLIAELYGLTLHERRALGMEERYVRQ